MVTISVLGPLEVRRDGELVRVPGGLTSQLLVRLALDAGCVVRADRLLDDLWAAEGAPASPNTLQSKVARLRRSLGDTVTVTTTDGGYRLDVERTAVDALAVLDAAVEADRLLSPRRAAGRRRPLRRRAALVRRRRPRRGRRLGGAVPRPPRPGSAVAHRDERGGSARAGAGRDRDRRPAVGGGCTSVPRGAVGAADHGALPRRPASRRPRGWPTDPGDPRRRARPGARAAAAAARAPDPHARPGARGRLSRSGVDPCRRGAGEPADPARAADRT